MIDDSHATGILGETGRGTAQHLNVKIDVISSSLGKALGGASGGYTASSKELIQVLRNKARPYVFSNALAPPIVGATIEVFKILTESNDLKEKLQVNV